MELSGDRISALLAQIYGAASKPELWLEFLEDLRRCTRSDKAFFLVSSGAQGRFDLSLQSGFDAAAVHEWQSYWATRDILLQRFLSAKRVHGEWIGSSSSVVPDDEFRRNEGYRGFMVPQGQKYQCGAALSGPENGVQVGLSLLRPAREGEFDSNTVQLLSVLAPHLARGMSLYYKLQSLQVEGEVMRQSVEELGCAVIAVREDGCVVSMSRSAAALTNGDSGMRIVGGRLCVGNAEEQATLMRLVMGAAKTGAASTGATKTRAAHSGDAEFRWTEPRTGMPSLHTVRRRTPSLTGEHCTPAHGGAMLISRPVPLKPLQVTVSPFRSNLLFVADAPAALIFLNDPEAKPESRARLLQSLYKLSPTEARITDLLVAGCDLGEVAEQLRMMVTTARFHLKSVFRKTGVHRQSELVRLVLALPGQYDA